MAGLVADFFCADAQILPCVRAVRVTRVRPPVLMPVPRIGSVSVRKSEVSLGSWIVGGLMRQIDLLAVLFLHFLVHMGHVNGLLFVGRGRREKHEQVVALLRRSLGSSLRGKVNKVDVVGDDVRVVLLSPCLPNVPSNQVSVSGTKWPHLRIFSLFFSDSAPSGNRK